MKRFSSIVVVLGLCVATLSAVESQKELINTDKALLFGNTEVNVVALSDEEMKNTTGEFWLTAIGITGVTWGLNCLLNKNCKDVSFTSPPINW